VHYGKGLFLFRLENLGNLAISRIATKHFSYSA
jgi:hypothetical protein